MYCEAVIITYLQSINPGGIGHSRTLTVSSRTLRPDSGMLSSLSGPAPPSGAVTSTLSKPFGGSSPRQTSYQVVGSEVRKSLGHLPLIPFLTSLDENSGMPPSADFLDPPTWRKGRTTASKVLSTVPTRLTGTSWMLEHPLEQPLIFTPSPPSALTQAGTRTECL